MSSSNLVQLTQGHSVIASKKRAKPTLEVKFDDAARYEFLTGFHKRKVAKTEAARKKAIEREKQQRQEDRREQRRMLRERAAENAAEVEKAYGAILASPEDQEWHGISEPSREQKEQEYEDEHVLATVAVVEDFDPDTLLHGPTKAVSDPDFNDEHEPASSSSHRSNTMPKPTTSHSHHPSSKKIKQQPKKVRYQTKEARKSDRNKQRARRTEKAELAGGKAARRKSKTTGKRR